MFKNPWTSLIVFAVIKVATLVFIHKALEHEMARILESNPEIKDNFFKNK